MLTTCIGAYPKPQFVNLPDWFNISIEADIAEPTKRWADAMQQLGNDAEATISRGVQQVISEQVDAGIDIPTDGEIPRENYIHYHCRHLNGFDFQNLSKKEVRGGSYSVELPTIRSQISSKTPFLVTDWRRAQSFCSQPVKITMPGPLTIADTNYDDYYHDPKELGKDAAAALNNEILALAEAGCQYIQIDEPVFARYPDEAVEYGVENIERAFHGCPKHVTRCVHVCCGYPDQLDREDYPKAAPQVYFQIADALEDSTVQWISIEDAHCHNDLTLLERFPTSTIIFGVVAIARSRVETVDEIRERLQEALQHLDKERLVAAPDCGLGLLSAGLVREKLHNMSVAAKSM